MSSTVYTLDAIASQWSAAQAGSSILLWRFAHNLVEFVGQNPKLSLADIGKACADSVGRAKPYSKGWTSRAVKAGKAFASEPIKAQDQTAFTDMLHGIDSAGRKAKKQSITADQAVKAAIGFANKAVKLGMGENDIVLAIAQAIGASLTSVSVKSGKRAAA